MKHYCIYFKSHIIEQYSTKPAGSIHIDEKLQFTLKRHANFNEKFHVVDVADQLGKFYSKGSDQTNYESLLKYQSTSCSLLSNLVFSSGLSKYPLDLSKFFHAKISDF